MQIKQQVIIIDNWFVRNNQLQRLPAEIGNLRKLQELDVRDNQMCDFSIEIGNLINLKRLDISNNYIPDSQIENIKKMLPNCEIVI